MNVEESGRLLFLEIREQLILVGKSRGLGNGRVGEDDPGADTGAEVLGREGPEGHVLPGLDVACTPVVHENVPKDVLLGLVDGDRLAEVVGAADEHSHLELEVKALAGGEGRDLGLGLGIAQDLAPRAADGGSGDDDAAGATVVCHGEVLVVGLEGVFRPAEEDANIVGVVGRRVEVGVVPDGHGHVICDPREGQKHRLPQRLIVLEHLGVRCVVAEDALEVLTDLAVEGLAEVREAVQGGLREDVFRLGDGLGRLEATTGGKGFEVEGVVADGDGGPVCLVRLGGDDAKRYVGNGEGRVGCDW